MNRPDQLNFFLISPKNVFILFKKKFFLKKAIGFLLEAIFGSKSPLFHSILKDTKLLAYISPQNFCSGFIGKKSIFVHGVELQ